MTHRNFGITQSSLPENHSSQAHLPRVEYGAFSSRVDPSDMEFAAWSFVLGFFGLIGIFLVGFRMLLDELI